MKLSHAALYGAVALLAPVGQAQVVTYSGSSELTFFTGTRTQEQTSRTLPTDAYPTYASKITLTGSNMTTSETGTATATSGQNGTSTEQPPQNTQPCNRYVEFCKRKYSNITMVGAHNSPFVRPGSVASNQALPVKTQLDDGVRFLQGQMHWPTNGTAPHFCHTSCDLLDAGPITDWLSDIAEWVEDHPYDVVTVLLGNGNYSDPSLYVPYIEESGITKHIYQAPFLPMGLGDWPTLENMILLGQRVVMFLDYEADQKKYPWLMDEFSQIWETPFDPTDRTFPCVVQRPPNLKREDAQKRMYIMNHNLNAEFNVFDIDLVVPAVAVLNETNAAEGFGSAGRAANDCESKWDYPPNVLNVDYYNYGSFNGSVFKVAAELNNVSFHKDWCCGTVSAATMASVSLVWTVTGSLLLSFYLFL